MSTKVLQFRGLTSASWSRARSLANGTQPLHSSWKRRVATPRSFSVVATASTSDQYRDTFSIVALAALVAFSGTGAVALCEQKQQQKQKKDTETHPHVIPSEVAAEDFEKYEESVDIDAMPLYTSEQVAEHDGQNGASMWMSYGGIVYDVTDFVVNHPGGSERISSAAGSAVEPFWHLYRQHYASDLPMKLMEHMAIGRLAEADQEAIDEQMSTVMELEEDPYAREPMRHKVLMVHSDTPMNAETPSRLLTSNYLTPSALFYIRHHHPVPFLSEKEIHDYRLKVDLTAYGKGVVSFSMDELKKMKKVEVTATLQCSGNRRVGFNDLKRTSGTPWGQGAVSTAKWGGVRLADLLELAGLEDAYEAEDEMGLEHVRFHALDGMSASIGIEKALNPYGDVIVCYEMNDEPLPRDHGFPLRIIVPGYAAVRNVKWVEKIELAKTEAVGAWQRGLNYKTLPPAVTDAKDVNLDEMPSMTEVSTFSGITHSNVVSEEKAKPGNTVTMKAEGWAWAGGGRNIVRVDVTGDGGKSWATATLTEGKQQRFGRSWAWVFWECDVPAVVAEDGTVQLASKAVDLAFNSQPESSDHGWNVRGLGNNAWYKQTVKVCD